MSIKPYIRLSVFILTLLLSNGVGYSQLQTSGGQTAFQLVQNTLLGGGVELLSVTFQGSPNAIGTFNGSSSNIGIGAGVIMTTGVISGPDGPVGPNSAPNSGVDNGYGGYGLLENIVAPTATFNATVIEFRFIPQGDSINFKYVFASEEYKEYVGTQFNDVFGFFLTGPNPSGPAYVNKNIALVPNSTTPVAINNVNHITNSQYYVDNEPGSTVSYDGFTKPLIAMAAVVPCQEYVIRLAITDVGDGIYDSGVFLEEKSFESNGMDVSSVISGSFNADTLYETCGQGDVTITITGNTSIANIVNYQIYGTATQGVDYTITPPGNFINFAPGQSTANLTIHPINDGVNEPLEYIIIELVDTAACPNVEPPRDTIWLQNVNPLLVTARPDTFMTCNNVVIFAYANTTGGAGNVTLSWNNSLGDGNYIPFIARNSDVYVVTAIDQCGTVSTDSFTVTVPNAAPLSLIFTEDSAICPGSPVQLNASIGGGIGDLNLTWSTGQQNILSQTVFPDESTLYSVILTDSCGNSLSEGALITVLAPDVSLSYTYLDNRYLQFYSHPSPDVVSYFWDFGDGGTSTDRDPNHRYADSGYYQVMLVVTNEFGCTDTAFEIIYAYPDFKFFIPNTFTPNTDGLNDVFTGKGMGFVKYEMRIFNRWGQEIFYTNDINRGWPGTDEKDVNCPIGVYTYRADLETPSGRQNQFIGHVNLLR